MRYQDAAIGIEQEIVCHAAKHPLPDTAMAIGTRHDKIGVLFVHGIGEQKKGATLVACGEPLVAWLRRRFDGMARSWMPAGLHDVQQRAWFDEAAKAWRARGEERAIADRLEAKRKARFTTAFALPPMPPMPPMPASSWTASDGRALAVAHCGNGADVAPIVNRDETDGGKHSRVVMIRCGDTAESRAARLSALRKARDSFARGEAARSLSESMRAKVAADLDRAIAETEKADQ